MPFVSLCQTSKILRFCALVCLTGGLLGFYSVPKWINVGFYGGFGRGGYAVFRGVNTLNLDAKGRMAMPSKYRDRLTAMCDGHLIVTVDLRDPCLLLYPQPEWEDIERKLVRLGNLDPSARRLQRLLIGHATEADLDGNGRILVPPPLREFAGLNKKVALIGQGKKFELWDEQVWNEERQKWLAEGAKDAELSAQLESLSL